MRNNDRFLEITIMKSQTMIVFSRKRSLLGKVTFAAKASCKIAKFCCSQFLLVIELDTPEQFFPGLFSFSCFSLNETTARRHRINPSSDHGS
jgi:hypothetical protein